MVVLHHVNLGVPVGRAEAEASFLVDLLGYRRIVAPDMRGIHPMWFEGDDGTQIHLSEDPDHRPASRAHVAVEIGDDLTELERRLEVSGYEVRTFEVDGRHTAFCQDPAGNRWELRTPSS